MRPASDVLIRRMPGGAVLVHLRSNRIFELNETGARVWELLVDGHGREALLQRLVAEFDVTHATADTQVDALLTMLTREGLLNPA